MVTDFLLQMKGFEFLSSETGMKGVMEKTQITFVADGQKLRRHSGKERPPAPAWGSLGWARSGETCSPAGAQHAGLRHRPTRAGRKETAEFTPVVLV